jgi:hypothetical protein
MRKKYNFIYLILIPFLFFGISACKPGKKITYKEIKLQNGFLEYKSENAPVFFEAQRYKNKIFALSVRYEIWWLDLEKKVEQKIITNGIGPDQILKATRIHFFDNKMWVKSSAPWKFIYYFDPGIEDILLKRKEFNNPIDFDDFKFISENALAMTFVYWENEILRLYDFNTGKIKKLGKPTITPFMLKFDISRSSLAVIRKKAYITHGIIPEIQVVSLENDNGDIDTIKLSPPFYIPVPGKYIKNRYDDKAHRKWMASWTSVYDILNYGDWLLVKYKYGYDFLYCYELIDVKNIERRYYINNTGSSIYDFRVNKNKIEFDSYEVEESTDNGLWKKQEAYLY